MRMSAIFNEAEDTQLQGVIEAFKAQGASVRIGQIREDGTVDVVLVLAGCKLEGDKGIELQSKLFVQPDANDESDKETTEPVEGEVVSPIQ